MTKQPRGTEERRMILTEKEGLEREHQKGEERMRERSRLLERKRNGEKG